MPECYNVRPDPFSFRPDPFSFFVYFILMIFTLSTIPGWGQSTITPRPGMTMAQLQSLYPDSTFGQITHEEFLQLQRDWKQGSEYYLFAVVQKNKALPSGGSSVKYYVSRDITSISSPRGADNVRVKEVPVVTPPSRPSQEGYAVVDTSVDLVFNIAQGSGGGGGGDLDVIIYVIIGLAVAFVFIAYAGQFLYDLATGRKKYEYWWDLEPFASFLIDSSESGALYGLKLTSGFRHGGTQIGLTLEGGYMDISAKMGDTVEDLEIEGAYANLGPSIRWLYGRDDNPSFFFLEFMAGWTEVEEVGLISAARLGWNMGAGSHTRLGFNLGALYMDIDEVDSIVREEDNFSVILGTELGIRF